MIDCKSQKSKKFNDGFQDVSRMYFKNPLQLLSWNYGIGVKVATEIIVIAFKGIIVIVLNGIFVIVVNGMMVTVVNDRLA